MPRVEATPGVTRACIRGLQQQAGRGLSKAGCQVHSQCCAAMWNTAACFIGLQQVGSSQQSVTQGPAAGSYFCERQTVVHDRMGP